MSFADTVNVEGLVPSGGANAGNPVKIGAVYNTTAPAPGAGDVVDLQSDSAGNLLANVVNAIQAGTAGSPGTSVLTVQGPSAGGTPVPVTQGLATTGGPSYSSAIAPATAAISTVKGGAGQVYQVVAFNSSSTPVFIKFFDAASPTLGTTACSWQYMIPGNTQGTGFTIPLFGGRPCANAIKYAVTGGISTTDATGITANSVVVDITYH